jgi:Zn-dependent protease
MSADDPALPTPRQPDLILGGDGRVLSAYSASEPLLPIYRLKWRLAAFLFALTVFSTWLWGGPIYSAAVMTILLAHELGHFIQTRRYGVPAGWPIFLPMPLSPIGTLGALIVMRPRSAGFKAMFDIAVSGPLAGLVPTLVALWVGLPLSQVVPVDGSDAFGREMRESLLLKALAGFFFDLQPGQTLWLHPLAFAGWVGLFITSLNLLPIGQLDGGHILFTLLPRRAHQVSQVVVLLALGAVVIFGAWQWTLMVILLIVLGLRHPPLAEDPSQIDLDLGRRVLGWALLAFMVLGFTPTPFGEAF